VCLHLDGPLLEVIFIIEVLFSYLYLRLHSHTHLLLLLGSVGLAVVVVLPPAHFDRRLSLLLKWGFPHSLNLVIAREH
jgi:hypothetical protein